MSTQIAAYLSVHTRSNLLSFCPCYLFDSQLGVAVILIRAGKEK